MSLTLVKVENGFIVRQQFQNEAVELWVAPNLDKAVELIKKLWNDYERLTTVKEEVEE